MIKLLMRIKIIFIDKTSTSIKKKNLFVEVNKPVKINELFKLAEIQERSPNLYKELKNFMISYKGKIINYEEALNKEVYPGEEILLLPIMEDG